jgi:hypothetical protein
VLLALGNGAAASQDASIEFMEMIPQEVESVRKKWQRENEKELGNARKAENELENLRAAIRNLRDVSGRHHTEIACERLFALLPENDTAQATPTKRP